MGHSANPLMGLRMICLIVQDGILLFASCLCIFLSVCLFRNVESLNTYASKIANRPPEKEGLGVSPGELPAPLGVDGISLPQNSRSVVG